MFTIRFKVSAVKELRKLPTIIQSHIRKKLELLKTDPTMMGVQKINSIKDCYRIRVGEYRIVYTVFKKELLIHVIRIGHRKEVYKKL